MARRLALATIALGLVIAGCGGAKVRAEREIGSAPVAKPAAIYVADFELDAQDIRSQPGLIPRPRDLLRHEDPAVRARELVELMSTTLVSELTKRGFTAQRLAPDAPLPAAGWLVRGVFAEVDEGNRLRRAIIGFGAGKTQTQVVVSVHDLVEGAPKPFYEMDVSADSRKAPGAGPMIKAHPAAIPVRLLLSGRDVQRNVKQTAEKIATDIAAHAAR